MKKVDLDWADVIIVMEADHRAEIGRRYPRLYLKKKILSLDIPDMFMYGSHELETMIIARMHVVCDFPIKTIPE